MKTPEMHAIANMFADSHPIFEGNTLNDFLIDPASKSHNTFSNQFLIHISENYPDNFWKEQYGTEDSYYLLKYTIRFLREIP